MFCSNFDEATVGRRRGILVLVLILVQATSGMALLTTSRVGVKTIGRFGQTIKHGATRMVKISELKMSLDESLATTEVEEVTTVEDRQGNTIGVGSVIRIAVDKLKAYQVPAKGQGLFNDNKEFVPAPQDSPRGSRNLVLPVGLRGEVTKIYDVEQISSKLSSRVEMVSP